MSYLLDTNVLSEISKKQNRDSGVSAWIARVMPDELFVSVLSLGEIRRGIELRRRWGRLSPSQPLSTVDGLLPATAIEHKLTVVTRYTQDFARSGVNLLNPFGSPKNR